jgi:PQQ-like domain
MKNFVASNISPCSYVISNNGTRSATVFALRALDGMPQWTHDIVDPTYGGPAYGNGVLYVGDQAGNIVALDAASGVELWSTALPQRRGGGSPFTNVYQGVICADGCGKVCHSSSAEAMLDLSSQATAYKALVGVAARGDVCMSSGQMLVNPMNAMTSLFYTKLAAMPACGVSMPPGSTPTNSSITPAMRDAVRAWIAAGAPND